MEFARKAGNEIIDLSDAEKARFNAAIAGAVEKFNTSEVKDGMTGADVVKLMKGM